MQVQAHFGCHGSDPWQIYSTDRTYRQVAVSIANFWKTNEEKILFEGSIAQVARQKPASSLHAITDAIFLALNAYRFFYRQTSSCSKIKGLPASPPRQL